MGIDAVAVLRIANLPPPQTKFGPHPVEHRGDATLIDLMVRFDSGDPDEHALALRRLVGSALDAHDDPRGILFFRDVKYPRAMTYDPIVSELLLTGRGVWAPKVEADYIPMRYRGRPRQPHDALVGELISVMGRDAALHLDMLAQVNKALCMTQPERIAAAETYRGQLDAVIHAMGANFAQRYESSLQVQADAIIAAQSRSPILVEAPSEVANGRIPDSSTDAPENTHEALVGEMAKVMGSKAEQVDFKASMDRIALEERPGDVSAADAYRAHLEIVEKAMGAAFARSYDESLKRKIAALRTALKDAPPDWFKPD